ncbi:hypothetical protein [Candidatus Coxiella mudrowiae]|uniref:hypothetical protein n=1 Tax=Candidatus Coxiella mudrowiae TaxID=2054173 RepID=UPI00191051FF|nr:hypothetical protein [Candidatus Coxiella mudrowiae]
MEFVLLSDYLFNANSVNIRSDYCQVLKTVAALINSYHKVSVKIAAYTDNLGNIQRQQALTTRQA